MNKSKINWLIVIFSISIIFIVSLNLFNLNKKSKPTVLNIPTVVDTAVSTTSNQAEIIVDEIPDSPNSPTREKPYRFMEVINACSIHSEGTCVSMRSGPGTEFPIVLGLRTGIVLSVEKVVKNSKGENWLKIHFVNQLTYPERVKTDLYVSESVVKTFYDIGNQTKINKAAGPITKKIVVNVTEQMLYAYDGDVLFMQEKVSTGLKDTPTKVGKYSIYKKTPSRYMQGAADGPADQYYDLPGVPWNLYFTYDGDVIHGAYWHSSFGQKWSHGCVNMEPQNAKKLYEWAVVGTPVIVEE